MIKRRAFTMFLIAVLMAVGAAWVANNWLQMRLTPTAEAATTPVVVAALKIPYGQKIERIHIKTINLPDGTVPAGTFSDQAAVLGKVADQTIFPGEFLINERIVEKLGGSTLSALVTPHMRAVTVRVNDVVGVAGFLLPGNRVDVVASRREGNRQSITRTILQDLKVLAVDQITGQERDGPVIVRAVTLEVTSKQAETLVKATQEGKVLLTLRNPLEKEEEGDMMAAQRSVLNLPALAKRDEPAPPPRRAAPVQHRVSVLRGTQMSSVNVRN
jgi:pilus assembly protein CpaB